MCETDYNSEHQGQRKLYQHLNETVKYASACEMLGDHEGEFVALKHAIELTIDLLERYIPVKEDWCSEDAVELDGMRTMSRKVQDIQEAWETKEEVAQEAHVVPLVHGGNAPSGEVLNLMPKQAPADSHHGTNGINPKVGVRPRKFRLFSLDKHGVDIGLVDEGTAGELASRNNIGPSTVYKNAGKEPRPGSKWRVEEVKTARE